MRGNGITHPGIFNIDQAVLLAGLPDDLADGRIMNMGYLGEKMMLDLEVQSAYQPGNDRVAGSKISRRLDLVHRPFVFQLIGVDISNGKSRMLHRMRQLEYQAQHKTGDTRKDDEPNHPVRKTEHINGKNNE